MDGYDGCRMALQHPIDQGIREYLRREKVNQADFAKTVGRNQPWLNKYINGDGHATVDDVIRIVASLIGAEAHPLTETERQLLKSFHYLETEDRNDVLSYTRHRERLARRAKSKGSSEPGSQMPPATVSKGRGKR